MTRTRKTARRDHGDGALYRRASDGLWVGAVTLAPGPDGRRRRRTVSSRDYATAARKLRELVRAAGDNPDLPSASMTVEKWLAHWVETIAAPNVRPKTLVAYRSDIRLHIVPAVGRYRLDRLGPEHVRAMAGQITSKGRSSTTALRCHATLGIALNDAVREGHVSRNVAALVKRPPKAVNNRGALTVDQAVQLLRHADASGDPLASFYAAALFTGARRGELLGLQDDRVTDRLDIAWQLQRLAWIHGCAFGGVQASCGRRAASCPNRLLEVPPGLEYRVLDGGLVLTRPKSKKARVIPLVEPLTSILATRPPGPHGLLWTTSSGKPIDPRDATAAWRAAVAAAGLPAVPLHAARHTTVTLLLAAGVPERVIQQIVGHSSVVTTQAYMHVDDAQARGALEGLGRLLVPSAQSDVHSAGEHRVV